MAKSNPPSSFLLPPSSAARLLTQAAFLLLIALVIARATMLETTRDPFEVSPGSMAYPRGLGAAGSAMLDWLAWIPVLLILVRSVIDRSFALARAGCFVPLILLGTWAALSSTWATDRFAAVVGASHFIGAIAVFLAAAQLVRSGLRLRFVAAACVGLMFVIVASGLIYRFVELPDTQRSVQERWPQILAERGWSPDSFMAKQFYRKVMSGEMVGFSASPNTLAATLVTLSVIAVGVVIQRIADRDKLGWPLLVALPLPLAALLVWYTNSRAALATPILATGALAGVALFARFLHSRRANAVVFIALVLLVVAGAGALVAYGLSHDKLPGDSLTFRWKYWVGSARLFAKHSWLGVGWGSFGDHYLAVRELVASEEIKDPHNLFVRLATELGAIGLALAIAWLAMSWWEATRSRSAVGESCETASGAGGGSGYGPNVALPTLIWTSVIAVAINVACSVDFTQDVSFTFIELMKRLLYVGLLIAAFVLVSIRSFDRQELDDRPARWMRRAMLVAMGVFLLHNTIDISFFETGPMWAFMLVGGAMIGVNAPQEQREPSRAVRVTSTVAVAIGLATALFAIVIPLMVAESKAQAADDAVRARDLRGAAGLLLDAHDSLPFANADYLFRAGRAQSSGGGGADEARATLRRAMAENPAAFAYPLALARVELLQPNPDAALVREMFERGLSLNPNDVATRLDYAQTLERFGMRVHAAEQYRIAMEKNEGLSPDEPKRLPVDEVRKVSERIDKLTR